MTHKFFLVFLNTDFDPLGAEKSCLRARLGFKRQFRFNLFHSSKSKSVKNSQIKGEGRDEGSQKSTKKSVTYYFNGPNTLDTFTPPPNPEILNRI